MTSPVKLHLGCGPVYIPGFIHIDANPHSHVDHVCSVDQLDQIADDSVDLVYACHVLEHFGRNEYQAVLTEWYRVLKPRGILRLSVPDFAKTVKIYVERNLLVDGMMTIMGSLVGGQRDEFDYHKIVFDRKLLDQALGNAGFTSTRLWDWRDTEHAHIDDHSQAYLPHMDKENGILMSLNMEAVKGSD
ncbi:class I SAM-dependent methyltransferase [Sphingorhabdus sp. 109]|jgi:predicted SAM-dependent methyltransferase|uniref:class I SAM-dependent methyltransferase n=1 Tax=Sphingorhabdus sp. 109 TaxID=2653173 RepID=UPI0012F221EE|nr:methyltransferase domain-containing protein [Sphingorhabdus sp. 109]VWX57555.1 Predicted SAM-depedendent methyltransferase [Sphingorhabdus sp. 109]